MTLTRRSALTALAGAPLALSLATVAAQVRDGEGSLGKLVMDDELYAQALSSVQLITRSLEDFREAAPITTFTSVLFGAF